MSGVPFSAAGLAFCRVCSCVISSHLRAPHENGDGSGHDRGKPIGGFGGDDFREDGFEDGKAGVDDSEDGFHAGEQGDEGVDFLGVIAGILEGDADAGEGNAADTEVSIVNIVSGGMGPI